MNRDRVGTVCSGVLTAGFAVLSVALGRLCAGWQGERQRARRLLRKKPHIRIDRDDRLFLARLREDGEVAAMLEAGGTADLTARLGGRLLAWMRRDQIPIGEVFVHGGTVGFGYLAAGDKVLVKSTSDGGTVKTVAVCAGGGDVKTVFQNTDNLRYETYAF